MRKWFELDDTQTIKMANLLCHHIEKHFRFDKNRPTAFTIKIVKANEKERTKFCVFFCHSKISSSNRRQYKDFINRLRPYFIGIRYWDDTSNEKDFSYQNERLNTQLNVIYTINASLFMFTKRYFVTGKWLNK